MRKIGCKDRRRVIVQRAVAPALALLLIGPVVQAPCAPAPPAERPAATTPQQPLTSPENATNPNQSTTPAAEPPAPAAGAPVAPASTTIGTAITEGASGPPGAKVMTLDQVVALAINNNSNVVLARQRLQKVKEGIVQVDAQARPHVNASLVDTYSSLDTFSTSGVTVASPSLPGGGQIPTVTDQGGGSTGSFTGGGGGGTANGNYSTFDNGLTSGATGYSGANSIGSGSGAVKSNGTGTISGAGTSGAVGTGTGTPNGSTSGSSSGSSGASASPLAVPASLPAIAQKYEDGQRNPHADSSTGSSGGSGTRDVSNGQRNNYAAHVSVTQYIDLFGLVPAAKDVENITQNFYELDLTRIQNEAALSSKDYFFNVLRDQETVNVDQEQVAYATENVRIAQAQLNAGSAAQFDVLTAQVTLANDQQALQTALNQLNIDRANLNNLIGVDPSTIISLKAPPLPPLNQPIDLKQSTAIALRQRPELREAENNIEIAKKLIKLAGAPLLPSLGVGAGASYSGPTTTNNSSFDLSAQLNFPLYDGGVTKSQVRQADIDLQTQLTTQSQLVQNVTLEVRQAYLNVSNAQNQASTAGVGVTQAEEAVRLAQLRRTNGLGTFLDVINAQAQLATARNNLAAAQYDYQTSLAQLVRAEGGR